MAIRVTDLPLPRRNAMTRELLVYAELEREAVLEKKIHIARCYEAGMTLEEMAVSLEVTKGTISRWRDEGQRERERQREEQNRADAG